MKPINFDVTDRCFHSFQKKKVQLYIELSFLLCYTLPVLFELIFMKLNFLNRRNTLCQVQLLRTD